MCEMNVQIRTAVLQHKTCSFVPDFMARRSSGGWIIIRLVMRIWQVYQRILEDGAIDVSRIIYELKDRHEVGEKEILDTA